MKKKKLNKKGFTLIELLATIAVLSIVVTTVIYVATNVIKDSKEKSYKVTLNNIQTSANEYILEELDNTIWVDEGNYQYQCVSVSNLVDAGYFKSDILDSYVAEGINVKLDDYVYLERDRDTKSIVRNVYTTSEYDGLCSDFSERVNANINFSVKSTGWSQNRNISIVYNIHNVTKYEDYSYDYAFNRDKSDLMNFNNSDHTQDVLVNDNGILYASIKQGTNTIVSESWIEGYIDKEAPKIEFATNGSNEWSKTASSIINVTDEKSGVDNNKLKYRHTNQVNLVNKIDGNDINHVVEVYLNNGNVFTNNNSVTIGGNLDGEYYIIAYACDMVGNCSANATDGFRLDNTVPTLTINYPTDIPNGTWFNKAMYDNDSEAYKLTLLGNDEASGIDYYAYDSSSTDGYQKYSNSTCINGSTSCTTGAWYANRNEDVNFQVCDKAGNCNFVTSPIKVDRNLPTLTINYPTDIPKGTWFNKAMYDNDNYAYDLTLNGNDVGSGIKDYAYKSSDDNDYVVLNCANGSASCDTGAWTKDRNEDVSIRVCDNADNCVVEATPIKVDRTGPTVPSSEVRNTNSSGTKLSNTDTWRNYTMWWGNFSSTDTNGSGVNHYEYSSYCSGEKNGNLSSSYTYDTDRNWSFCIRAVDNAGNSSNWSSTYYFKIDKTAPTLSISYPSSIPKGTWFNKAMYDNNSEAYKLTLNGNDNGGSGIKYYAYDSSSTTDYKKYTNNSCKSGSTSCTTGAWTAERNEDVKIKVCDNLDQCTVVGTPIKVDRTAPTVSYKDITVDSSKEYKVRTSFDINDNFSNITMLRSHCFYYDKNEQQDCRFATAATRVEHYHRNRVAKKWDSLNYTSGGKTDNKTAVNFYNKTDTHAFHTSFSVGTDIEYAMIVCDEANNCSGTYKYKYTGSSKTVSKQ